MYYPIIRYYKVIVRILHNEQEGGRGLQMIALHVILTIIITAVKLITREGFEIGHKLIK